jgi:uncharacterized protein YifN (PemK superfamily)
LIRQILECNFANTRLCDKQCYPELTKTKKGFAPINASYSLLNTT